MEIDFPMYPFDSPFWMKMFFVTMLAGVALFVSELMDCLPKAKKDFWIWKENYFKNEYPKVMKEHHRIVREMKHKIFGKVMCLFVIGIFVTAVLFTFSNVKMTTSNIAKETGKPPAYLVYQPNFWFKLGFSGAGFLQAPYIEANLGPNRNWNFFSIECTIEGLRAHDIPALAFLNRTTSISWAIPFIKKGDSSMIWSAYHPNQNDFLIEPLKAYYVDYAVPYDWYYPYTLPPPNPPLPPNPWVSYGAELHFPDGICAHSVHIHTIFNWGAITGMYYTQAWNPEGSHTAWELGLLHLFNSDGLPYTGQYSISFWGCTMINGVGWQGWHTYTAGGAGNFIVTAHMGLSIWTSTDAIYLWEQ